MGQRARKRIQDGGLSRVREKDKEDGLGRRVWQVQASGCVPLFIGLAQIQVLTARFSVCRLYALREMRKTIWLLRDETRLLSKRIDDTHMALFQSSEHMSSRKCKRSAVES